MTAFKIIAVTFLLVIAGNLLLFSFLRRRIAAAKAEALAAPPVIVTGGCHCGSVRFSISTRRHVTVLDCNCSICQPAAYLHLIIPHQDFTLLSGKDNLTSYRFNTGTAEHLFCRTCGTKSFYQPRSHPDCWSVHFRCLDKGHDLVELIQPFDDAARED